MIDIRSQAECERREVAESAGYPQVRVEICFDNQQIVLETTSNHVHLLPWTIHAAEEVDSAIDYAMQDISILRAKSRLDALELLIQRVSSKHPEMVEHSLENARKMARKVRVETSILYSLNQQPMSKNVADARMKVGDRPSEHYLKDLADCIDLEITEIELADRIVAIIEDGLKTKNK